MDTKDIVDRVLKGEDYSVLLKEVPEEKQLDVRVAVRDALDSQVKQKVGDVKKATEDLISVRRGIDDIKSKKEDSINNTLETFKKEQLEKAKKRFFSDPRFEMNDEQRKIMESEIQSKGLQSTDSDFAFEELKKVYASLFADVLLEKIEKNMRGSQGAARFIQGQASGSNTGPTGDPDKYSQAVRDLWEKVVQSGHKNFTLDQAKEHFEKGRNSQRML